MSKFKKLLLTSLIFTSIFAKSSPTSFADSIILNKNLTDGVNVRVKEDINSEIIGGIEDFSIYDIKAESPNRYEIEFEGKKGFVGKDRFYRFDQTSVIDDTYIKKTADIDSENLIKDKISKDSKVTILEFSPDSLFVKVRYDENLKDNKSSDSKSRGNSLRNIEINALSKPKQNTKPNNKSDFEIPQVITLNEKNNIKENKDQELNPKEGYVKLSSLAISKKDKVSLEDFINYYDDANKSIKDHKEIEEQYDNLADIEYLDSDRYEFVTDDTNTIEVSDAVIDLSDDYDHITVAVTGSDIGIDMYERAMQFLGNPYVWGGVSPTDGIDCSGYTMQIYRNIGIELPHFAQSQQKYGVEIEFGEEMAGDLVFFGTSLNNITHVGMADGNGNMIHASSPSTGIIISPIYNPISIKRIVKSSRR